MDEKESASAYGTMFSSVSEDLSRLLPGPAVPGFQKVKDMLVKRTVIYVHVLSFMSTNHSPICRNLS